MTRARFHLLFSLLALSITAGVTFAISAFAAYVTQLTFVPSSYIVGASADQAVEFVTPSGVHAPGDSIVLDYREGFDLSTLSSAVDFDLAVDDDAACDGPFTDKSLASAPAAGVWGVEVSGQTIAFTPPSDAAANEIATDRCVLIQIGTNAVYGGTGVDQIVNPVEPGSYAMFVKGGFGDTGGAAFSVLDDDTVMINAEIAKPNGGTNPPPSDVTPPLILNLTVSNVTDTSARVSWNTDDQADAELSWGATASYEIGTLVDGQLLYSHVFDLSGLTPGTTYYVKVVSADDAGNEATATASFTTTDHVAPELLTPQITDITPYAANVLWLTDEPATSIVLYGLTSAYELGYVNLTDLVTDHWIPLTGLEPGTTYHVQVRSVDAFGNESVSNDLIFTTLFDLPPANVIATLVPGDHSNAISWILPSDEDLVGVRIVYRTDRFPTGPFDGYVIYDALGTSFTHLGLTPGVEYFYALFAYDAGGNFASGALVSGIPYGTVTPPSEIYCGDGTCNGDETQVTCPVDCGAVVPPIEAYCGDGACNEEETSATCPADCGPVVPPTETYCGDSTCNSDETQVTCPADCGAVVLPGEDELNEEDIQFLASYGQIVLQQVGKETWRLLASRAFIVSANLTDIASSVASATITFDGHTYLLSNETAAELDEQGLLVPPVRITIFSYIAQITAPEAGLYPLTVDLVYADGRLQTFSYTMEVVPLGLVFETVEDGTEPLAGATLELFAKQGNDWVSWNGYPYFEDNPVTTQSDGTYGWYVPNGFYYAKVTKEGYYGKQTASVKVGDHIVGWDVELTRIPPPIEEILAGEEPWTEKLAKIIGTMGLRLQAVYVDFQGNPFTELILRVEPIVMMIGISLGLLSLILAFGTGHLMFWLTLLNTYQSAAKKKKFGAVFLATTGQPVDHSRVLLYRLSDNQATLEERTITDRKGRYGFTADAGTYRLVVQNALLTFPSQTLKGLEKAFKHENLYHGETVTFKEKHNRIAMDIPVDPVASETVQNRQRLVKAAEYALSGFLLAYAAIAMFASFTALTVALFIVNVAFFSLAVHAATHRAFWKAHKQS